MNAPQNFASLGPKLLAQGFEPIPVAGKAPAIKRWQDVTLHRDQVAYWAQNGQGDLNVGLRTAGLAPIDVDIYDVEVSARVVAAARARFGDAPERVGMPPKALLLYAAIEPGTKITSPIWVSPDGKEHRVEVLGIGQQFVAAGIHPDTHKPYTWKGDNIADLELWMLPAVRRDEVAAWINTELPALMPSDWVQKGSGSAGALAGSDDDMPWFQTETDLTIEECIKALELLPAHRYSERDGWLRGIFAMHHQFSHTELNLEAREATAKWAMQWGPFVNGETEAIWDNANRDRPTGVITMRTVLGWLKDDGKDGEWKAYQAERKAAASAAVVVAQGWESQIKQAPDAATLEKIAAQVRATPSLSEGIIATLAGLAGARCKVLNIDMRAARWKKLMTPRAKATHPASVDLADFIPYGLPEPELNPSIFPHVEYTETTIRVKNTLANAARMLEAYGITAYYDGIKKKPVINIPGMSVCSDQADTAALARIESLGNLNGMAGEKAARFAATVAYENQRNLIGDWIKSAPWDGQDRIAQLCNTLTVRPDFPLGLRNLIVRRWLISAAAAALKPAGFYSKGVLTLQGPQSIGKTPWVASLLPDGVLSDYVLLGAHLDPYSRDSVKTAVSHWIVELGEVDSTVNRAEGGALKAFLSQRTDKLRLPYAPVDSEFQRRTVFAASVNPQEFLKDETGNKRWWTLPVTAVNFNHGINLQQLWAQVAAAYEAKEPWWLTFDEENRLECYNSQHTVKSSIHEILADALDFEAPRSEWGRMTASGVLRTVLQIKVPTNAQAREAGAALRALLGEPTKSKGHPGWWVPPAKFDRLLDETFDD